jgi:N-sulfoglucosamine sulfohydrolase
MANSDDPHRPYAGSADEKRAFGLTTDFTREVKPEDAWVPPFLPDIPGVRKELAEYYTSSHRADQSVGAVLHALDESGLADNTLVMFLSDNGIALPFAKTNCYLHSTKTPWIVRWPGVVKSGAVNRDEFILGNDFLPTVLDAAGLPPLDGIDGASFVPLLRGTPQPGRDHTFTVFHETSAHVRYEMRCLQERRFGYIWNAWSDGRTKFRGNGQAGLSWKAMVEAAAGDKSIAERVRLFELRAPEELYDFSADPDGLRNLAEDPRFAAELARMRSRMRQHLARTSDPLAERFAAHSNQG